MFVWIQVLEEREKLKQEREVRMKKKEYLMKELERLRKQQGEFTLRRHVAHRPSPAPLQVGPLPVCGRRPAECQRSSDVMSANMCN